jgi:hypothetical protein
MVEPVRHRQTKEAETDMFDLQPPRHISTLQIEQAAHPGICLFFKDRDQPAFAISDCSHTPEQTFNIHK